MRYGSWTNSECIRYLRKCTSVSNRVASVCRGSSGMARILQEGGSTLSPWVTQSLQAEETTTMADVLTVVTKIRAAKGKGDALAALLKEQVAAVRKAEPGCLIYRPHRSTKDPDLFIFYEQYKDDAAFDLHRKAPHLAPD